MANSAMGGGCFPLTRKVNTVTIVALMVFTLVLVTMISQRHHLIPKQRLLGEQHREVYQDGHSVVHMPNDRASIPKSVQMPIPPFKYRAELGDILNAEGMRTGVELGVQRGLYSLDMLSRWKSCTYYVLVDLWKHQENYKDAANLGDAGHAAFRQETMQRLRRYSSKLQVCQDYTTRCAEKYRRVNTTFDFIYVDARHDYKGVLLDLNDWYPMLKRGGIIAGHDYVTNDDGPRQGGQDWSINFDGTRDPTGRAVKGAVDDFAAKHGLQISVSYRESGWNTWAARKPF